MQHVGQGLLAAWPVRKATWARVAISSSFRVSATGRVLRPLVQRRVPARALRPPAAGEASGAGAPGTDGTGGSGGDIPASVVANCKQRAAQRRKHRQFIVGPLDRCQRARIVSTSSRSWNDLPPTSRCAMSRASSACTYGRVTSWLKLVNRRNNRQTCRGRTATCSGFPVARLRSVTVHPLWSNSHSETPRRHREGTSQSRP